MHSNKRDSFESHEDQEDEIDLSEYIDALLDAKWLILVITMLFTSFAGAYAYLTIPIYQADALLQVEEKTTSLGSADLMSLMGEGAASASTEIEIIRSRLVIGKVVDDLRLTVLAKPKLFPVIGDLFYRTFTEDGFREPLFGLGGYAWGGQKIKLDRLDVTASFLGKSLCLVIKSEGEFQLLDDDVLLLEGHVGVPAESSDGSIKTFISELSGEVGTNFTLIKLRKLDVIRNMLSFLNVNEKGKGTGIISLSYTGPSAQLSKDIVDTIAKVYLRQNVERKSEEAKRSLVFLQQQLPEVRGQLEAAETRMNEYRLASGSVDLNLETQSILEKVTMFDQELSKLDMNRTDLAQQYTGKHPLMLALKGKYNRLLKDKKLMEEKIKQLPKTEQELLTLMRNVKVNAELYTFLLNKSQELKVVEAGTVGNVRILDLAFLPYAPVKPKKIVILLLGVVLGMFFALLVVFIRKAMRQGVEDPNIVEKNTGLSVFASIPHSDLQVRLHKKMRQAKGHSKEVLLTKVDNNDLAIESLRSLRTNLHFALLESKNNIVMLTGPAPGLGKSFVSANFAAVLAASGQKVLLIDADMRKGHLHEYFGLQRTPGLSGFIAGNVEFENAVRETEVENLSMISTGVLPPNPADLLMNERFGVLLDELSKRFDLVLIDTPPVLAVTDAVLVGRRSGVNFMLLRSGKHPMREIEQAIRHVDQAGVSLAGCIFNDIIPKASSYGYYQYAYNQDT